MHTPADHDDSAPARRRRAVPRSVPPPAVALPAVQRRARATRDAMLSVGRALLQERNFDDVSIADLASANGLSVGSFYGRFRDKASYFALLQQQVTGEWLERGRAALAPARRGEQDARGIVAGVCATFVDVMRRDAGFVRASLKHASTYPGSWTLIRQTGGVFIAEVAAVLGPRLTHLPPAQREPRIGFALQMMFGTGVNAVLNDPGPIPLADARLERELARALTGYLEIGP
jgi:AcrR family transcriptional regulator